MNLSANNFSIGDIVRATFIEGFTPEPLQPVPESAIKERHFGKRYSYESKGALYDVEKFNGQTAYKTNMRPSDKNTIHEAIEKHFNL